MTAPKFKFVAIALRAAEGTEADPVGLEPYAFAEIGSNSGQLTPEALSAVSGRALRNMMPHDWLRSDLKIYRAPGNRNYEGSGLSMEITESGLEMVRDQSHIEASIVEDKLKPIAKLSAEGFRPDGWRGCPVEKLPALHMQKALKEYHGTAEGRGISFPEFLKHERDIWKLQNGAGSPTADPKTSSGYGM